MKVLVGAAGAGFIGSHTVDVLLAKSCEVGIMDSLEPPVHLSHYLGIPDEGLLS